MKQLLALGSSLIFLAACASEGGSQRAPARAQAPAPPSVDEVAVSMERDSQPGQQHRSLGVLIGAFETTAFSVDAQGQESDPKSGHAAIDWIFGGRYLRWDANVELTLGLRTTTGFLGYSAFQQEFQLLFISDLSTGMSVARGRGDTRSGGIRFELDLIDPRTGAIHRAISLLRSLDADHFLLEQLGGEAGDERVVRRTYYRRVTK